jgi:glyoxylate reductase
MSWNVFITRRIPPEGLEVLRKGAAKIDLHDDEAPLPRADLLSRVGDCDGLMVTGNDRCDAGLFGVVRNLKIVSCIAVGYDNVDVAEATRRRIAVTNTPDVLTDACADLTWALILAVARRVIEGDRLTRSGEWRGWAPTQMRGVDVAGKTIGIIGAGRIGTAVAKRATGFSMRVLTVTHHSTREEFEAILRQSDFVTVHVPLSPETRHMFGDAEFRMMKPTAYFINMARGPVHDETALMRALREGWIAGTGLDVYEHEPKISPELAQLPNTVLLPHLGSATIETRRRMAILAAENLLAVLNDQPCPNVVNRF